MEYIPATCGNGAGAWAGGGSVGGWRGEVVVKRRRKREGRHYVVEGEGAGELEVGLSHGCLPACLGSE